MTFNTTSPTYRKMIDFTKAEQYILSVRLATDNLSFYVSALQDCDMPWHTDMAIDESCSLTANLKQIFDKTEWLHHTFRRVNVLMADKRFTLIPLEFFDQATAQMIFYHNHIRLDNETVKYNLLQGNNLAVIFGMDKSVCEYIAGQYPEARFYSHATPLIDYFKSASLTDNHNKMYVHLRSETADVFCYGNGNLLLGNSYRCDNLSDRIYHILYVWKMLGFDQDNDQLHLTGILPNKEELQTGLRKYVRQVFIMNQGENIDLKTITTCEL